MKKESQYLSGFTILDLDLLLTCFFCSRMIDFNDISQFLASKVICEPNVLLVIDRANKAIRSLKLKQD